MGDAPAVQSLERTFGLLELLSLSPAGLHLQDLVVKSGLHKSTVHRLLASLITLGYVRKVEGVEGKYKLTLKLVEMAGRVSDSLDVVEVARPVLALLRDRAEEAVHLVVRDGVDIVYVHKWEQQGSGYQMFSRIGMRRPLYCTGVGKCILSLLADREVARIWSDSDVRAHTPNTIVELDKLYAELDDVRAKGYALDNEENELGVRCVAAPIRDYTGQVRAAFSVSAPKVRLTDTRLEALLPHILEASRQISAGLGYADKCE